MSAEEKKGKPRFAPKSVTHYVQVIKMVVGLALDDKGEPLYPVKWNHNFMDLPEIGKQRKPAFTAADVTAIISKAEGQFRTLYALLAGTGLRIEEAIGLQLEDVQGSVLYVRHRHWNGGLYARKTAAGIRAVDLHSPLASLLREHVGNRTSGFVCLSSRGKPLSRSTVLRRSLPKILKEMGLEKPGFHGFRRFRITHLRKQRVKE